MKLSILLNKYRVFSSGFPAIAALGRYSKGVAPVVLSSLPPSAIHDMGVEHYFTLVLPRGTVFNTAEEIIEADPDVKGYEIYTIDTDGMPKAITTQHQATLDVLAELYPDAEIISQRNADGTTRNLTPEDVKGKHVIGVLPPFLVAAAGAFTSASIKYYNAATDGDLSGDALRERLDIAFQAIKIRDLNNYEIKKIYEEYFVEKGLAGALLAIDDIKKKIDPDRVKIEYYMGWALGTETFNVKLTSKNLKYHWAEYAPGGDTIFLGYRTKNEFTAEWPVPEKGEEQKLRNLDELFEMLDWAEKLNNGEVVELREPLSYNYLRQKVW